MTLCNFINGHCSGLYKKLGMYKDDDWIGVAISLAMGLTAVQDG